MALTMIFALVGALLFALFVVPAASSLLFARGYREWHNPWVERIAPYYERLVAGCVRRRAQVGVATVALVGLSLFVIVPRQDVRNMIDVALGGSPLGQVYEEDRIFPITARFRRDVTSSPTAIGRLPVYTADDIAVPLSRVARIRVLDGQTMIARENGRRRLTVHTDIVGRDQGSFVSEA